MTCCIIWIGGGLAMKRISIFIQLVLIIFVVSAIPAISVIYVNNVNMRKTSEGAIAESALNKLRANQELCDEMISNIVYNALDWVLVKQYANLNGITTYRALNSDYKYVDTAIKMKSNLSYLADRNKLVHSAFYYMDDADYVISTNGGLVKLDAYDSLDWLGDAVSKIRGVEGTWFPRSMITRKSGQEDTTNIISYLYRSNSLYTSIRGSIVINVYEDELSNLIYSDVADKNGEGFLMNGHGDVIAHSNSEYLYQNVSDMDYVSQIINSNKEEGYGITKNNDFLYTYKKSQHYDWIYVNAYSLDQFFSQSKQIIKTGIITTLLIILVGATSAVLIALGISKPIRRLADEMRGLNPEVENGYSDRNEITYLAKALGQIRGSQKSLKDSLAESEESVRRVAIYNLIRGDSLLEKEKKILEKKFLYNHFIVCILTVDNFASYQMATSHQQRKQHRSIIYEYIRRGFPEEYLLESIRYNVRSIAVLINFKDYDSAHVTAEVKASLRALQKEYQQESGQGLSIGVSQVYSYLEGVKTCMDEAYEALKRKLVLGKGKIIFFRQRDGACIQTYDSYRHEKRIKNYLEIGDMDKISKELERMVTNIQKMDDISVENIMLVFNQLIGTTLMYLNKYNYNAATVLGANESNLYSILAELETIDEIKDYLESVYKKILDYHKGVYLDEDEDYSKTILRYLKQNYQKEIDFEELSEEIGISYSYLRKIIRESTGRSLTDNLNLIRIGEAKIQLERTDLLISQIATSVGYNNVQSLNRFFKKYEGISPSDYKMASSEAKDQATE